MNIIQLNVSALSLLNVISSYLTIFIKKNCLVIFFLILIISPKSLFANAGVFAGFGQTLRLEKTNDVQMVSEEVNIFLLRSGGRVTGSLRYVDRAHFNCKFLLRNLTDKKITIPVGFPLSSERLPMKKNGHVDAISIIANYNFVAGNSNGSYAISYVPYDRKRKYGNIFLWTMQFEPNESIELTVSYEMNGYAGLGHLVKDRKEYMKQKYPPSLDLLGMGSINSFGYVTSTGNSWYGKIEKAIFRVHLGEFEEYLQKRGHEEALPTDPYYNDKKELPAFSTLIRNVEPKGWTEVVDKHKRRTLVWEYTDYVPQHDLMISYLFCAIPVNVKEYEHYLNYVKKRFKSPKEEKDVADVILEFYGIKTGNRDIQLFVNEQKKWYPIKQSKTIDKDLKQRLLSTSQHQEKNNNDKI